jgi:hypothetical protein
VKILAQLCSGDSLREYGSCWTEVASFYGVGNHTDRVVSAHIIAARQNTATQQGSCAKVWRKQSGQRKEDNGCPLRRCPLVVGSVCWEAVYGQAS